MTAVQLMPVFQFDPQEDNYWGYMPLNFFAPHNEYSVGSNQCEQLDEFRSMVRALHAVGIEVILDVVFNHTCEQDAAGPMYSLKGIDNSTNYMLDLHADVFRFFKMMIAFRKAHPSISRSRFWRDDIRWYGTSHDADLSPDSKAIAWCLHGGSQNDDDLYVMVNADDRELTFGIHEGAAGEWSRIVDTSHESGKDIVDDQDAEAFASNSIVIGPRSVVVLVREK